MNEDDAELRNPFPSPPSHYTHYTSHNLNLLSLLHARAPDVPDDIEAHAAVLSDQKDVPDWSLQTLQKPRVDWIVEDGHYSVFGNNWRLLESIPSLADVGGEQLYPAGPTVDRRPALMSVLRSILVAFSSLLQHLLVPPHPHYSEIQPEWHRTIGWITVIAQNVIAAANDLRPVQARCNLESMMRRQLELRRQETKAIHEKCDLLELRLAQLRLLSETTATGSAVHIGLESGSLHKLDASKAQPRTTPEDVLYWAESAR